VVGEASEGIEKLIKLERPGKNLKKSLGKIPYGEHQKSC